MRLAFAVFLLALTLVLQHLLGGLISVRDISPVFYIIVLLYSCYLTGRFQVLLLAFVFGTLYDIINGSLVGAGTFAAIVAVFVFKTYIINKSRHYFPRFLVFYALALFTYFSFFYFIIFIGTNSLGSIFFRYILPVFIYTQLAALLIYLILPGWLFDNESEW